MRLVRAVFDDGLRTATRLPAPGRRRQQRLYLEARAWVEDDDRTWPFAFANLCEFLGLDPSAVRRRVLLGYVRADTDRRRTHSGRWGRRPALHAGAASSVSRPAQES